MNTIFESVEKLCVDYQAIWAEIHEHIETVKEIREAIKGRIEEEKRQTADRIFLLEEQSKDTSRTATARRFAERELVQLREKKLQIAAEELNEFENAMREYEQSAADARKVYKQLSEAIKNARLELERLTEWKNRGEGIYNVDLLVNWIEGERKEFDSLVRYAEAQ